ncbi:porin family protein [Bradyrhizobium manausense]|uniref:outer membrane protein n=1 Tax=Bradyrhizobium TaxID=374 RepID=UPI001BABF146|nr:MULTISPECIES: outer membrane protein [Bradyrhizobium]MBR0830088.1 porin family protein [Bradyrhizobium manausense]UVO30934.1 porin family protein [Bradyrhizobium arachidis]
MLWNNLRASLMVLLSLSTSATIAAAADVTGYKVAPVAAYNWNGFYVGGHAGYGWSRSTGNADPLPSPQAFGLSPNTLEFHSKGALGGIQAGYNWQFAPNWVVGIEADISWSGIRGRQTDAMIMFGGTALCPVCSPVSFDRKWDHLGTFRGRLGYTQGHWLAYATGGFAFGSTRVDTNLMVNSFTLAASAKTDAVGYAVGAGAEYALAGNWTLKSEYLFTHLGDAGSMIGYPVPFLAGAYRYSWDDTKIHAVRIGVNYRFGDPFSAN